MKKSLSRRDFLKCAAVGAVSVATIGISGCASNPASATEQVTTTPSPVMTAALTWRKKPDEVSESEITATYTIDVLVVGAGNAGVYAACSIAEEGANILMIEKGTTISTTRGFIGGFNTNAQAEAGIVMNRNELSNELCRYANNNVRQDLINTWLDNSATVCNWMDNIMQQYGNKLYANPVVNENMNMKEYPTHQAVGDSDGVKNNTYLQLLLEHFPSVETMFETSIHYIIQDDNGRVTGAYAKDKNGKYIKFNTSKGVIICTGGYEWNQEMMEDLNGNVAMNMTQNVGWPLNTGDGIRAGIWAGATMEKHPSAMIFDRGAVLPGGVGGPPYDNITAWGPGFVIGSQPFLSVNKEGKRFTNESVPYDFKAHAAWQQTGSIWFEIFDSNWTEDVMRFNTIGCSRIKPTGYGTCVDGIFDIGGHIHYLDTMKEAGALIVADTLDELAEGLGLPADQLKSTVERYNELYDIGMDEDYGKEAFRLSKVATPPYYGITLGGHLLCTMQGLTITDKMEVLDEGGNVIPGLYAAGNAAGGFFSDNYPELVVGVAVGKTTTFGYLAGKNILKDN